MKHLDIRIQGKVQGVFYRASARTTAIKLGITGFVRNEPNGDVFIAAEGESAILDQLLEWCRQGPAQAHVTTVDIKEGVLQGYTGFEVRR